MIGDWIVDSKVDMNKSQTESKRMKDKDFRKANRASKPTGVKWKADRDSNS